MNPLYGISALFKLLYCVCVCKLERWGRGERKKTNKSKVMEDRHKEKCDEDVLSESGLEELWRHSCWAPSTCCGPPCQHLPRSVLEFHWKLTDEVKEIHKAQRTRQLLLVSFFHRHLQTHTHTRASTSPHNMKHNVYLKYAAMCKLGFPF